MTTKINEAARARTVEARDQQVNNVEYNSNHHTRTGSRKLRVEKETPQNQFIHLFTLFIFANFPRPFPNQNWSNKLPVAQQIINSF